MPKHSPIECPRCGQLVAPMLRDGELVAMKHYQFGSAQECRGCDHMWQADPDANPVLGPFTCPKCGDKK